jgi:dienelactone hydrolase
MLWRKMQIGLAVDLHGTDGTPRHMLIVKDQLDDYRTVIKYARQQPEFDPQRVVVWGSSFSGLWTELLRNHSLCFCSL